MAKALSLFDARRRMLARAVAIDDRERVPLAAALGRTLAEPIGSDGPWPATDRSAMDGFALRIGAQGVSAGATRRVVGESLAGKPFVGQLTDGEAIRIMTGAVVPPTADAVVPVEDTSGFVGESVQFRATVQAGQNIRRRGSELTAGAEVLAAGRRLDPAAIGVLAVLGVADVPVVRAVRVAIVATGDEVVPLQAAPLPHQVRESNSWALAAQVAAAGGVAVPLGIAPDEPAALRRLLEQALAGCDVVLTIGGISKGTHDLFAEALQSLGVAEDFHGIQLKPGKPTFFGVREVVEAGAAEAGRARQYVVGLPGNPASAFTVFDLLVRPLLTALAGGDPGQWTLRLPWTGAPWRPNARLQAVPARLVAGDRGLAAELAPPSPSGDPFGLVRGGCYALIDPDLAPSPDATVLVVGGAAGVVLP
jgi:molybdopterin molybdotransferase